MVNEEHNEVKPTANKPDSITLKGIIDSISGTQVPLGSDTKIAEMDPDTEFIIQKYVTTVSLSDLGRKFIIWEEE